MARIFCFPYKVVRLGRIELSPWKFRIGDDVKEVGGKLPFWDPSTAVWAQRTVELDLPGIWEDCHLSPEDILSLSVVWASSGTNLRGRASDEIIIDYRRERIRRTIEFTIEGAQLSRSVSLTLVLILVRRGRSNDLFAPRIPGSILWKSKYDLLLEGLSSRFPIELIDFRQLGWMPHNGLWFLEWDSHNLHQSFLGGVRLYLNSGHEIIKKIIERPGDAQSEIVYSIINFDIGRNMISSALRNPDFVADPESFQDGTVGAVCRRLINTLFQNETISVLINELHEYPARFDCRLQDKMKLFASDGFSAT